MTSIPHIIGRDDPRPDIASPVDDLRLDHVEIYVEDLDAAVEDWTRDYGFTVTGTAGIRDFRSAAVRQCRILLVLTEGTTDDHPAAGYVRRHGPGVARIALRTSDVAAAFAHAVHHGAWPVSEPVRLPGGEASATVGGFGDVLHTLVQRDAGDPGALPPGFRPVEADPAGPDDPGLLEIDHFAVCVRVGELQPTIARYRQALGFAEVFEERIVVGTQAMLSSVVKSRAGDITLTVIQPDPAADPGQIDAFLDNHGGSGVQHIAFASDDAVGSVRALGRRGVEFLRTPATYYELLEQRVTLRRHALEALRELHILADEDHDGQLFQIFTRTTHPRRTLFFEVIERLGAQTFGAANIKALYEAVELERQRDGTTTP